mmetsp:Transcript_174/g.398  ORF Transcript_174/g.398 Transcript_174/m.398 type:complete len:277 (-) Transcript_174:85-915(-)|eukprot:CAMPEP_0197887944 /NCGR_PEP_ID=MMETSP1439-20131203/20213_1 /TAXON_ID=66791 /ORGANISM="Gonyaulax spinifera, Strain CCMP409" /LENGTH=276 /DNA_ID=CAMNT_0043507815 /DNA_START=62 /DNA_END=892 /DNA_ORIENTATION=+
MAPVKFDDIHKVANEVLSDDYQTSGFQFKSKQKTNWDGAVVSSQVDLFPAKESVQTPAKLSWKLPTPLGLSGFAVDKLEMDKAGKFKLEASSDKVYPALKVECKSDLADLSKVTAGCTYTGIKDTFVKLETKPMKPQDTVCEVTRAVGIATCGVKFDKDNISKPDLGLRLQQGPFFCSLLAKGKLSTVTAHGFYKASSELKCAATCDLLGKKQGAFTCGLAYDVMKGTKLKAKLNNDMAVSFSVKHELRKGFTVLCGGMVDTKKGSHTYGVQLSIE